MNKKSLLIILTIFVICVILALLWIIFRPNDVEKNCRDRVKETEAWVNEIVKNGGDVDWDGPKNTYKKCLRENGQIK